MKLDRLLAIIIMLLNRKRIQARELAEYFEVSKRTIYRDIESINNAGIPIITYQGKNGGLGIVDTYKIDRQVLSLQDMISMLSVLKGINTTFPDKQLDGAIEKIHALVPENDQEYVKNQIEQIVIDVMPWGSSPLQKKKMTRLQQAITGSRLCRFSYHDSHGNSTMRKVEPMTLVFKAMSWYLFAYCRLRNDFRIFKLSRIQNLEVAGQTFTRKKAFFSQYDSINPTTDQMVSLHIRFARKIRHEVEEYLESSQIEELNNGDIITRFEMPDNDWIAGWLLSLGENAEVMAPASLRRLLSQKAKKITELYKT